jgi:hypothetical protein
MYRMRTEYLSPFNFLSLQYIQYTIAVEEPSRHVLEQVSEQILNFVLATRPGWRAKVLAVSIFSRMDTLYSSGSHICLASETHAGIVDLPGAALHRFIWCRTNEQQQTRY